jgi:hypothetical protein
MWPFKRKTRNPDRLPIDGPWSIAEGQNDGRVMIVRSNAGYRDFGSVPGYEVGIAVPLRSAEPTGLPSHQSGHFPLRAAFSSRIDRSIS